MMDEEPSYQQQTTTFFSDSSVVVVQAEEEKQGLGFGVESAPNASTSFCSDPNVGNPSGGENDQADENHYNHAAAINDDDDDDQEAERIINEELINLLLDQAVDEQKSHVDREENDVEDRWGSGENENVNAAKEDGRFNGTRKFGYPLRPDADDCAFYMKTGSCKFGANCKFNHPPIPRKKYQSVKEKLKQRDEYLERPGQTECKYYLSSGGCKYGKSCKYNHSREKHSVPQTVEFNFLGLPIRPGEKECTYYMRNGSCKYGSNCRFNHPDPTAVGGVDPSSGYGNGVSRPGPTPSSMSSWSSPRALNETASYVPMMFQPSQGVPSTAEWNGYHEAPVYTTSERGLPTPPAFTMENLAADINFSSHPQQMLGEEFPERPGQPECTYFMKTGDCKYKFSCKFHHPKSRINKSASIALSDKGLPLRPDQTICSFYIRYGICKFGPSCKFDHSENLGGSVSSGVSNYE